MSDFLMRLILRSTFGVSTLRPRPRSRYESSPAGSATALESAPSDPAERPSSAPTLRTAHGDAPRTKGVDQVRAQSSKHGADRDMPDGHTRVDGMARREAPPRPMHSDVERPPSLIKPAGHSEPDVTETIGGAPDVSATPSPSPAGHSIPPHEADAKERASSRARAAPVAGAVLDIQDRPRMQASGREPKSHQFPAGAVSGVSETPIVKISIGRVEVRAVSPAPATVRSRPPPHLSLEEYLRRRQGAER